MDTSTAVETIGQVKFPAYGNTPLHRIMLAVPWLVFLLSLSLTGWGWYAATTARQEAEQAHFDFRVRETVARIEQRMFAYEQILRGVKGLFDSSASVGRQEFRVYVESLRLTENYPGIQGVGYAMLVPAAEMDKHLAAIRKQGFPDYVIRPEGQRDPYTSIIYLEPFVERNLRAFGYDMYSESVRRSAMDAARDSGEIDVSGKVRLVQESGKQDQAGFLMYLPVYRKGALHASVTDRRNALVGWVFAPFRMNDLMQGIQGERSDDLDIEIYDGRVTGDGALMYESYGSKIAGTGRAEALSVSTQLDVAGHPWTLNVHALSGLYVREERSLPWLIAMTGTVLSLLLFWLAWLLATGRERALQLARSMNRDLIETEARFRLMADSAPVMIWVAGTDRQYFWFNKVWLDFTGRSMQHEIGYGWIAGVHPDDAKRRLDSYLEHFVRHEPFKIEYRLRRYDGAYRWVAEQGIPRFGADDEFAGYIGSCVDITERKQAEVALSEREQMYRQQSRRLAEVIWGTNIGTWEWNVQTGETVFNERWAEIVGYSLEELAPININTWVKLAHPDDLEHSNALLERCFRRELDAYECEARMRHKQGHWVWVLDRGRIVEWTEDGKPLRMSGTHQDITERKQAEARLQLAAKVFTHAREAIMITDAAANIVEVNETFTAVTGYMPEEARGRNPRMLSSGKHGREFYVAFWQELLGTGHWTGEVWNRRKDGTEYVELLTVSAARDENGKTQNYVALFTDITPMKEHQQQLERIAHYDALTKLPNRVLLADRMQHAISQTRRRNESLAVVYLDLDGFKAVNDTYGHDVGDELLIAVTHRMKEALRDGDTLARMGGDEFVAVLVDLPDPDDCKPVLQRMLEAAASPIIVRNHQLQVSASIGVAIFPQDNVDADMLLRHADQAMYQAKQSGKNRYCRFDGASAALQLKAPSESAAP